MLESTSSVLRSDGFQSINQFHSIEQSKDTDMFMVAYTSVAFSCAKFKIYKTSTWEEWTDGQRKSMDNR